MNTQAWLDLWQDKLLREYICDLAAACSCLPTVQEDLIATAWILLGACECDISREAAAECARKIIEWRYRRYHSLSKRRWHINPVRRAIGRRKRKYFLKASRN